MDRQRVLSLKDVKFLTVVFDSNF